MANRFKELLRLSDQFYIPGSPVIIQAAALQKDTATDKVLAQVKLCNISNKEITACKVHVKAFEPNGTEVEGVPDHAYLDVNAAPGVSFGTKKPIFLPERATRSISVSVIEVVFFDGTIWHADPCEWKKLPMRELVSEKLQDEELKKQWTLEVGEQCDYVPLENDGLYFCTCGAINLETNDECYCCHRKPEDVLTLFDTDVLTEKTTLRVQEEERIAAEEEENRRRIEEEKALKKAAQNKKIKKAAAIIIPIALIIAIFVALWPGTIKPAYENYNAYRAASKALAAGEYDAAISGFDALRSKGYKDSAEMVNEAIYQKAGWYAENGKYELAISEYKAIAQYSDSQKQIETIKENVYKESTECFSKKQFAEALEGFSLLSKYNYSDAHNKVTDVHYAWGKSLFDSGDYKNAVDQFATVLSSRYEDAKELYHESAYQYAIHLLNNKSYKTAIDYFRKAGFEYKDTKVLFQEANYDYGCVFLDAKDYKAAVNSLKDAIGYKDARAKMLEAEYAYVLAHKNKSDVTTANYLKDLVEARYSGAQAIYNELYAWKVVYLGANSSEKAGGYSSSLSKYSKWYLHFRIEGGIPGGSTNMSYSIRYPDGSYSGGKFEGKWSAGDTMWVSSWWTEPAYGSTGTLSITIFDGNRNTMGSGSVKITN